MRQIMPVNFMIYTINMIVVQRIKTIMMTPIVHLMR